ncbi:MAG: hypothetical protein A3I66_04505 [Burkholderiales bacterium RIFCSPLOWO2_02_FULL_57_36]|nr:MAG: hypothetical protein A3I66_04505 [Burkholderiales bacterium RIFCSPLOWO2_02_FULL_57_36]
MTERAAITEPHREIGRINASDLLLWGFVIVGQIMTFFLYEYLFATPLIVLVMIATVVLVYKVFASFFGKGHR